MNKTQQNNTSVRDGRTKDEILESLPSETEKILSGRGGRDEKLLAVAKLLHDRIDVYDWVGFYLVDPHAHRELVLGPYVGAKTDHIRIPFGTGICGQAADTLETFVVDDVAAETNYLSCSVDVKSEIVVPIMKGGTLIGELDIDSHTVAAMTTADKKVLEEICRQIARLY
jgi:L-methionine (R)-S-oxide reductase